MLKLPSVLELDVLSDSELMERPLIDDLTPPMFIAAREHKPGWGRATLESNGNVTIHVGSPTAYGVNVCLTHPLVLGRSEKSHQDDYLNFAPYEAAEKGVSYQHATLEIIGETVRLTDLDSTNGTFLNGQRLPSNQPYLVRSGDEIRLGQLVMYIYYQSNDVTEIVDPQHKP